jgi:hypothetical protein
MSDTPETDANTWSDSSEGILYKVVSAEISRKLERERDEAREEVRLLKAILELIKRDTI